MDKEYFFNPIEESSSKLEFSLLNTGRLIEEIAELKIMHTGSMNFMEFESQNDTQSRLQSMYSEFCTAEQKINVFNIDLSPKTKVPILSFEEESKYEENHEPPFCHEVHRAYCLICLQDNVEFGTLGCSDNYCISCITLILEDFVNNLLVLPVHPACYVCSLPISDEIFKKYLNPNLYSRMLVLREKLHRDQLVVSGKAIHCIVPDCEGYAFVFPNEQITACIACRASLCIKCKRGTHPTLTCEENQALNTEDSIDDILFSRKWKRCPCCGVPVERIEGCNYIACFSPMCKGKKGLCYKCGKELDEEQHFSHYTNKGPYGDTCNTLDGLPG